MARKSIFLIFLVAGFILSAGVPVSGNKLLPAASSSHLSGNLPGDPCGSLRWADSVYAEMSRQERIGGLFWIDVPFTGKIPEVIEIAGTVQKYQPGGIIIREQGQRSGQVRELASCLQDYVSVPLIVAAAGTPGGAGFGGLPVCPGNMALAASGREDLLYLLGREMAAEYRAMHFNVHLPDFSLLPEKGCKPAGGGTGKGEYGLCRIPEKYQYAWIRGMQDGGIFVIRAPACGDEEKRSSLFFAGGEWLGPVDPAGSNGRDRSQNDEQAELALFAGRVKESEFLIHTSDIAVSVSMVEAAIEKGLMGLETIEIRLRTILEYKYRMGLASGPPAESGYYCEPPAVRHPEPGGTVECGDGPVKIQGSGTKLHGGQISGTTLTGRLLYESALTLLKNEAEIVPVKDLEKGRFACLLVGQADAFAARVTDYLRMPVLRIDGGTAAAADRVLSELAQYDRIIVAVSGSSLTEPGGLGEIADRLLQELKSRETVMVFFGPPSGPATLKLMESAGALLLAWEDNELVHDLAAQMVFGATGATGRLPVNFPQFPAGAGLDSEGGIRLKYTLPEEAGLDGNITLARVDSIVNTGLEAGAYPGCRVLVAKGGKIIVDRTYGHHTYSRRVAVEKDDIYDLASVTKISGPLPLYMKLAGEGRLDIDSPLSHYWDDWRNRLFRRSNKEDLVLRDLLTHQSGIVPYINYWEQTVRNGRYIRRWYRPEQSGGFTAEISDHFFLRDRFRGNVYRAIRRSELLPHGQYRYSCLPFIISPGVISRVDGRDYTTALYEDFYEPLGAALLRYNPLDHFPAHRIVPTEIDNSFRKRLVHGYVHDEAAAVLGGVSGNAGLFAAAGDLAKLLQMYLNGGEYGGRRYLPEEVLHEFTRVQFPENNNRRALGFDKPLLDNAYLSPERAYPCKGASPSSFGHSGFTGTFVWMDPEYDLLYIFLSNRVHPTRDNNLISTLNIRTEILQVFYDEFGRPGGGR